MDATQGIRIDESKIGVKKMSFGIIMIGAVKVTVNLQLDRAGVDEITMMYQRFNEASFMLYMMGPLI